MKLSKKEAFKKLMAHSSMSRRLYARLLLWDSKRTVRENAIALKISFSSSSQLKYHYALDAKSGFRGKLAKTYLLESEMSKIKLLRKTGYNYAEIGRLYKVSKQRIEQIIKEHP